MSRHATSRWSAAVGAGLAMVLLASPAGAPDANARSVRPPRSPVVMNPVSGALWKPNTHIFAANLAREDAIDDGMVTIRPHGEIKATAAAVRALKSFPDDYRGGVIGPDVFPDIYVGQSLAHADKSADHGRWTSDHWLRHVLREARALAQRSDNPAEGDRALAFAYGFVTHAAGDMFGHTYVNDWGDGLRGGNARVWDWGDPTVVARHVVLESYIGAKVPDTELEINVWPRFVSDVFISNARVLASTASSAPHYRHWVRMHARVSEAFENSKRAMRADLPDNATYAMQCLAHADACAAKEFLETWKRNIEEGMRELVVANLSLGRAVLARRVPEGISAFMAWNSEWTPKMHGAHAPAEAMKWIGEHSPLAKVTEAVRDSIVGFLVKEYPREFAYLRMMSSPATYMDSVYRPSIRAAIDADLHLGANGLLNWREFEPLYNTVILSKLALLDGAGLNELARRAGVSTQLYPAGDSVNVMFGVVRTMDGHYQWNPDSAYGYAYEPYRAPSAETSKGTARSPTPGEMEGLRPFTGMAFYGNPEAREKVFGRIFKGYGAGPDVKGPSRAVVDAPPTRRDSVRTPKVLTLPTRISPPRLPRKP